MATHPKSLANKSVQNKLHRSITKFQEANNIQPIPELNILTRIARTVIIKVFKKDIMD